MAAGGSSKSWVTATVEQMESAVALAHHHYAGVVRLATADQAQDSLKVGPLLARAYTPPQWSLEVILGGGGVFVPRSEHFSSADYRKDWLCSSPVILRPDVRVACA